MDCFTRFGGLAGLLALCWLLLRSAATIRVGRVDGRQAAPARPGGTVWQSGRVTSRHRGSDQRVRRLRRRSGVRSPRDPGQRLDGAGHRGQARGGQDGLPAAAAGFPVPSGLRLRRCAAAQPAQDRGRGEGVPVVLGPGPGREVDADLGSRDHALADLAPADPSGVASAAARRADRGDPGGVRAAARRLPPAPVDLQRGPRHHQPAADRPSAVDLPRRSALGRPGGPAGRGGRPVQADLFLPGRA